MGHQVNANDGNVVSFLKNQHKQIKVLFEEVIAKAGADREEKFRELCRLLTMHEAGEEAVVHPAATRALPRGEAVVAARIREETEAKKAISELKVLNPSSAEFDTKIHKLRSAVLAHAGREEREEFNKLAGSIDEGRLMRMRRAVETAESRAASGMEDTDPGVYEPAAPAHARDSAAGRS
jgi:hemerythrin superfamily protein